MNAHHEVVVPPESRFIVELWRGSDVVDVRPFLEQLGRHPQFRTWALPVEEVRSLLPEASVAYARAVDAPYQAYARARGKTRWGDKTPRYIEHIPFLADLFPEARFVHVVRDGRDVALSYADVPFGPKTIARAAELWARRVGVGIETGRVLAAGRYLAVRYEDLVATERGLEKGARALCDFLELPWDRSMLNYAAVSKAEVLDKAKALNPLLTRGPTPQARSWREHMPARQVEVFELIAGDVLEELGYERVFREPGRRARIAAGLGRRGAPIGRLKRTPRASPEEG